MRPRKAAKGEAEAMAAKLTRMAVETSHTDRALAARQAALARKVALRYNVRFDYSLKRFTCHGCKGLLVPGVNARVRLSNLGRKALLITCLHCGRVNRKILGQA